MLELTLEELPEFIREIPSPPKQLFCLGADLLELLKLPRVAIVGTRNPTTYGSQATKELASKLAAQGVVIVSGLAYGVDAIAHEAALEAGGRCIAVLPSPLDNIVPVANRALAEEILEKGGALVSEYTPGTLPAVQNFIARNRLVTALSDAVVVTEASIKSGTRHTVKFAEEQGGTILAVPGSIYVANQAGTNEFIKNQKAQAITSYQDVLNELKLHFHDTHVREVKGSNRNEQTILDLMLQGVSNGDKLLESSGLDISKFNQALVMLEISGKVRALGMNHWAIA
jgi:DNA processing protein